MSRKSTRRDFLRGKAAAEALADAAERVLPGAAQVDAAPTSDAEAYLTRVSRPAMACEFEVLVNAGQYRADMLVALEALDLVERLEAQMTYFRATSELSRINQRAAQEPVEVDPPLFDLLNQALQLGRQTGGAFDITAAPLWGIWGFARRAGRIPTDQEIAQAMQNVGTHLVELDQDRRTVRFLRPGVKVNLGSIGKGYALDRAAEVMMAGGIADFLLHGGQSSILARGSRLETATTHPGKDQQGWPVGIRHPLRPKSRLGEIRLWNQSLATSSSAVQFFRHQGRRYGHILDPRTGRPADTVLSVTVLAPTAALADALATAFYVMGQRPSLDYCRQHPEIGAVLLAPGKRGAEPQICTAGIPERRGTPPDIP